jgi:hypothetical protein
MECMSRRIERAVEHNAFTGIDVPQFVRDCAEELPAYPTTIQIDHYMAQKSFAKMLEHPHYGSLAGYLAVSSHQRDTDASIDTIITHLYTCKHARGHVCPMVDVDVYEFVHAYADEIQCMLDFSRDFLIDYFGFNTLIGKRLWSDHSICG